MKIAFVSYDFPEYCIRHVNEMAVEHDVLLMLPSNDAQEYVDLIAPPYGMSHFIVPAIVSPSAS